MRRNKALTIILNQYFGTYSLHRDLSTLINRFYNPFVSGDFLAFNQYPSDENIVIVIRTTPCFCVLLSYDGLLFKRKVHFDRDSAYVFSRINLKIRTYKFPHTKNLHKHFCKLLYGCAVFKGID